MPSNQSHGKRRCTADPTIRPPQSPTRINPGKYHIPGSHSAFFQTSMMNCTCSARGMIEHVMLHLLRGHASYYTRVSRTTTELFNWLHTCVLHHTCSCSLPSRILHLLITRLSKRKRRGLADAVIDFCPPHFFTFISQIWMFVHTDISAFTLFTTH